MEIELFGGPLDGMTLDHGVESEAEVKDEPWISIIWLEGGVKYAAIYQYRGNGIASFEDDVTEN